MDRRRPRRKRFCTIAEAMQQVTSLETKCVRSPELYSVHSSDLAGGFKTLITLCNSLAIVFMQYDLLREALDLLKKASQADLQLYKAGSLLDRLWQGRVPTYNNLAYLFQKVGDFSAALKFVYDSQSLLLTLQKAGGQAASDLTVATNFVTFLVLWKVKKFREAQAYIQLCLRSVNQQISASEKTRLSSSNRLNLLGIVVMALSAAHLKTSGDLQGAQRSVSECLRQLQDYDLAVKPLLVRFARDLQVHCDSVTASRASAFEFSPEGQIDTPREILQEIPSEYFRKQLRSNATLDRDWLISTEFDMLFFITVLLPFMGTNTPLIRSTELEQARLRADRSVSSRRSHTSRGRNSQDSYAKLMQVVMTKSRDSRRTASVRRNAPSVSPIGDLPRSSVRSSRSRTSREPAIDMSSLTPGKRPHLDRVREESNDMEDDEMNRTAPARHDREQNGERRFGSVPPVARKQVFLSPSLDTTRPRRRPKRTASKQADTLLMIELGQGPPLPLLPMSQKPRPIAPPSFPPVRSMSRRRMPSSRLVQSTSSRPKGHSRKMDSFVLLDISLRGESAEEPKVNM